jgi:hypothetical protein
MSINLAAIIFFFLALIAAILGIFGVPVANLLFWALAFLAAGFIVLRLGGDVVSSATAGRLYPDKVQTAMVLQRVWG